MKSFVGITGTTCVGKSKVAVLLAQKMGADVISADSMQVYAGMNIGTAKITAQEMCGVKHYMLDVALPNRNFSSFEFQERASEIIDNSQVPNIVVGGTGFYFDCLLYPPEFGSSNEKRRAELQNIAQSEGLEVLQKILRDLDRETYDIIDIQNPARLIRAIEIAESGERRSHGKGRINARYDCKLFVLQRNRADLYRMIDDRVDAMLEQGLVAEVQGLVDEYGVCDTSAFSAIGYKEIIEYLSGKTTLGEAVDKIKLNTRHYAKRQITYFKKMNVLKFIDVDGKSAEEVVEEILKNCQFQ